MGGLEHSASEATRVVIAKLLRQRTQQLGVEFLEERLDRLRIGLK